MDTRARHQAYPPLKPYRTGRLKVSPLHELYFEESGNPNGLPVVVLHGGPGGGSSPAMRRLHDPKTYRIIAFDQRGCGRSTPHAELRENTTWALVDDIETLRAHLGIERWQVFGGSWGSTLALAYAETHPRRVTALVLRGIFMLRQKEVDWFYNSGCNALFPDAYEDFIGALPVDERDDILGAFHRRLTGDDDAEKLKAAKAWSQWEGRTLSLGENEGRVARFGHPQYAIAFARIECHYFINKGFFDEDGQLLRDIGRIRHVPCAIAHGRYDVVTPVRNAWDLKTAWPEADLRIVPDAGHALSEPGIVHELVAATKRFASLD